MLGGWLYRRTFHVATTMVRSQRRRQYRERVTRAAPSTYGRAKSNFLSVQ